MKIFSIEHYEDKLEDLNRMEEIAAYHAGYADCAYGLCRCFSLRILDTRSPDKQKVSGSNA